jgi:ribosomal protein S17E
MLFVRDTAEELLEKYDNLLLDKERDKLKSILIEINSN